MKRKPFWTVCAFSLYCANVIHSPIIHFMVSSIPFRRLYVVVLWSKRNFPLSHWPCVGFIFFLTESFIYGVKECILPQRPTYMAFFILSKNLFLCIFTEQQIIISYTQRNRIFLWVTKKKISERKQIFSQLPLLVRSRDYSKGYQIVYSDNAVYAN